MKVMLKMMLVVALVAMMSGCVQMHMNTEIKKDGSGTMEMTMSLSEVVKEAIALEAGDDDLAELGAMMSMDKKELEKAIKGHDVKVKKYEKKDVKGRETLFIKLEFKDLEGLSMALNQMEMGDDGGLAIVDLGDGNYAFRPYEYDFPVKAEEEVEEEEEMTMDDMDPAKMQKQMEIMGKLMGAMSELDFSMKITVPGDIVESNAPIVEGRTSTWSINAANMMSAGSDMEPNIVFSGKGLKIKNLK